MLCPGELSACARELGELFARYLGVTLGRDPGASAEVLGDRRDELRREGGHPRLVAEVGTTRSRAPGKHVVDPSLLETPADVPQVGRLVVGLFELPAE